MPPIAVYCGYGGFFMQTENNKTALEEKTLNDLCLMEEIAEKKANVYAKLLMEPSLAKEMENLAARHKERRDSLERLLYGEPLGKDTKGKGAKK